MTNPSDEEKEKEMKYLISNHIDIKDDDNDEFLIEEDVEEASPIFESENKSLMDELKEVNLIIIENPSPSFININLSPKEERDYMKLLIEYWDIFVWYYNEMLGLELRVVVHQLVVKIKVGPIKQPQCLFHPKLISQIKAKSTDLSKWVSFIRWSILHVS